MGELLEQAYVACEECRQSTVTPEAQDSFVNARNAVEALPRSGNYRFMPYTTLIPSVGQYL
jgi:hypothetical protein